MKQLLTLLALVLCSCAETFVGKEIARPNGENLPDLTAAFAEDDTRTYVENDKYLRWHEDDRLTAFYGNTLNRQYKFNGATGDNSGTFSLVPSGELGTGNAFDRIYALYPYSETANITDEGEISLTLPAVQNYAENSFGLGANTMIAVTENLEDTFLVFKNACGYLKLKLYDPDGSELKSIEVKGNNGEKIAGSATATIAFGEVPVLNMSDDATTTITIDCGDGIAIGQTAETATEIWVVLPETTFTKGLTIVVTDTNGSIFEKSTEKEVVIERNAVQPMAALNAEFVAPVVKPANNEIWYTATEKIELHNNKYFGVDVVSNEWDSTSGNGMITFSGDVTSIGYRGFYNCKNLKSITIPDSITTIGDYAFDGCESLTSITIPDSVTTIGEYAFSGCYSLTNITIPDSVTTIGSSAFKNCSNLTSINIPDSVTTVGNDAFYGCLNLPVEDGIRYADTYLVGPINRQLTTYTIKDGTRFIGSGAFGGIFYNHYEYCPNLTNIVIPDSVISIGNSAFANTKLSYINIPNSVKDVGGEVFYGCNSLTNVNIPDSVTRIWGSTFKDCSSLTGLIIPNSVTRIDGEAFSGCNSLINTIIEGTITYIGEYAFEHCTGELIINGNIPSQTGQMRGNFNNSDFTRISISYGVTTIGSGAFSNCSSLTSVTIPDSVTMIGEYAFSGCYSLTSVTIPDSVTTIGVGVFDSCSNLTSVTIPDSVTTIGEYAFFDCTSLTSVTIPDSVTKIEYGAFENCSSLSKVYCKPTTPPNIDSNIFDGTASDLKIYVQVSDYHRIRDAYKDEWGYEYRYLLEEYDFTE